MSIRPPNHFSPHFNVHQLEAQARRSSFAPIQFPAGEQKVPPPGKIFCRDSPMQWEYKKNTANSPGQFSPVAVEGATVEPASTELLVRLLSRHQEDLFRYIFALLPHEEDARDALQETSVALYRKFAEYDPNKPFLAWAYGFAFLEILKQRQRSQRSTRLLGQHVIERLASERQQHESVLQARLQALDQCLQELPPADQELLRKRYQEKLKTEVLLQEFGPSRRTLFRRLERIRRLLFDCINRRAAAAGPV
jgi:RNA polymerase sigma-70 factor (ECF subfamily)